MRGPCVRLRAVLHLNWILLIVRSNDSRMYLKSGRRGVRGGCEGWRLAIYPIDTRAPFRLALGALYVVHYLRARAKMVCAAPGVRPFSDSQLARRDGARSEIAAARTMCVCAPFTLMLRPFSALQVFWQVYSLRRGAIALIDTRMPGRHARGASYVSRYLLARAKMACAAPGPRPRNDLQNAQRVGARSGIADARTMCFCAPLIGSKTMRVCIISRGRGEGAAVGYLPD